MHSLISGVITLEGTVASLTGKRGTCAWGFCAHQNGSYANMISVVSVLLKPLNLNDLLCFLGCSKVYWSWQKRGGGAFRKIEYDRVITHWWTVFGMCSAIFKRGTRMIGLIFWDYKWLFRTLNFIRKLRYFLISFH